MYFKSCIALCALLKYINNSIRSTMPLFDEYIEASVLIDIIDMNS